MGLIDFERSPVRIIWRTCTRERESEQERARERERERGDCQAISSDFNASVFMVPFVSSNRRGASGCCVIQVRLIGWRAARKRISGVEK